MKNGKIIKQKEVLEDKIRKEKNMSLRKEIKALLKAEEGTVKVNSISYLKRWTKDALGGKRCEAT